ncbi:hypothetical protein BJ742DRAFT_823808 [Cladochytrium replicatum]|nr:hypothetical protein BJ742DRAFT_823808 [Cladochytrium replicatum]
MSTVVAQHPSNGNLDANNEGVKTLDTVSTAFLANVIQGCEELSQIFDQLHWDAKKLVARSKPSKAASKAVSEAQLYDGNDDDDGDDGEEPNGGDGDDDEEAEGEEEGEDEVADGDEDAGEEVESDGEGDDGEDGNLVGLPLLDQCLNIGFRLDGEGGEDGEGDDEVEGEDEDEDAEEEAEEEDEEEEEEEVPPKKRQKKD